MLKTFVAYIPENKVGFCIQSYENNIALGIPVCFPSKACADPNFRETLYKNIEHIKEYVLTNEEKQQINEQINNLDLTLIF